MKYILPIILLLFSCASVQQLDGGDKDITPPQVQSVFPDSASLNVKSKIISFTFDEYISTTKTNELLIISPSQKINPTIESKGKKLIITLNDSLLPNTTYTIQFNRSVIDINEKVMTNFSIPEGENLSDLSSIEIDSGFISYNPDAYYRIDVGTGVNMLQLGEPLANPNQGEGNGGSYSVG